MAEMKGIPHVLKEGVGGHHVRDAESGQVVPVDPGSVVHLSPVQAKAWRDKFEPIEVVKARAAAAEAAIKAAAEVEAAFKAQRQAEAEQAAAEAATAGQTQE